MKDQLKDPLYDYYFAPLSLYEPSLYCTISPVGYQVSQAELKNSVQKIRFFQNLPPLLCYSALGAVIGCQNVASQPITFTIYTFYFVENFQIYCSVEYVRWVQ